MTQRRPPLRTALAALTTFMLAACSTAAAPLATTSPTATPPSTATPSLGPADLTLAATDGGITGAGPAFMPNKIEIKAGGVLRLDDTGTTEHNLTIDTSGAIPTSGAGRKDAILISVDLVDKSAEGTINLPPGTYKFYCSIDFGTPAGHASVQGTGMVGTLIVH